SFIAAEQPDVVQTWLYHADVLGTLATVPRTRTRLVWNIRNSGLEESHRLTWRLLVRSSALLSRFVDCIVSNSVAGMEYHQRVGYRPPRWELVPNGWVPARSVPSPLERAAARARFGLAEDAFLVGFPARRARQKDHPTFFAGARMVGARAPRMRFVLFGAHLDSSALASEPALADAATTGRIIVMGEIKNVEELLPALDCVTLTSSHGEGLPNAVGETMAAGLPVVATDVGDVRSLVDGAGIVAPARDPRALADAWIRLSELGSEGCISLGERGRRRIAEQYSLDLMVERYQSLYELLVGDKHRKLP
ncbi:MAG TPA: glycosyltransferase, partial [Beijerinckiaceae bacterium]|nr:glycosyltransferase [Beijerinckiaceae bacterium]